MRRDRFIDINIRCHDKIYMKYEQLHSEIFNPIEQERLRTHLEESISHIKTASTKKTALDYGCGTGNITRHLIDMGFHVVSADVSEKFLALVKQRYSATGLSSTIKVSGSDLSGFEDTIFDFVAAYSVLHHVPDYLQIIKEMIRVTKLGGVIYLDHEENETCWNRTKEYAEFLKLALPGDRKWKRFFKFSTYMNKLRRIIEPHYMPEGDIHSGLDDHIEWDKIKNLLVKEGCEIITQQDYLLYRGDYKKNIYYKYREICPDYHVVAARKKAPSGFTGG